MMIGSTAVRLVFSLTCVLAWLPGNAQADFGAGTITFEDSSYQLYTLTNTGGVATNVATGSTLTIADDAVIPISEYFKVGTDVYVRFGFDLDGDGDLDSSDTPAVIEATYTAGTSLNDGNIDKGSMSNFEDSAADIFAYTSVCKRRRESVALGGRKVQRSVCGRSSWERGWRLATRC